MKFAPKPFKIHPYDEMVEFKAPWIDELTATTNRIISGYREAIKLEAAKDGEPMLADENYLYDRFKDNCYHNMWKANWQVLKYFYQYFRMKIFYDIIGQWMFTDHDVEMYNYFSTVKVSEADKCKPSHLRFTVKPELLMSYISEGFPDGGLNYKFQYEWWYTFPDRENRADKFYLGLFEQEFGISELMIRNVKKLTDYNLPFQNFFTVKKFHPEHSQDPNSRDYSEMPNRAIDDPASYVAATVAVEPSNTDVINEFYNHCKNNVELCRAALAMLEAESKVDELFMQAYESFKNDYKSKLNQEVYLKKEIVTRLKYYAQSILTGDNHDR